MFIFDDFVYVLSGQAKARILEVNRVEGFHLVKLQLTAFEGQVLWYGLRITAS